MGEGDAIDEATGSGDGKPTWFRDCELSWAQVGVERVLNFIFSFAALCRLRANNERCAASCRLHYGRKSTLCSALT